MSSFFTIMDDRKDQKFYIRELLLQRSPRINLYHNSSGYSDVWKRFWLVQLDGDELDVAVCCNCFGILTYRPKDGTSGLKKHACIKHLRKGIPDLSEKMSTPDMSMLLERTKMTPRTLKFVRDKQAASCSEYTPDIDRNSPSYHIDNDAEDFAINHQSEEINSAVNESLNGPYLLKKETHCSTILDQLLRDDTYTDVTLTAEGNTIRAHKVVLSLSSGYFRDVLDKDANARNVVFFKDLKFDHLKNIINFIYTGEATIDAEELESFMNIAEMLEISSLADGYKNLPKVVFKKPTKSVKRSSVPSTSARKYQKIKTSSVNRRVEGEMIISPQIKTEPEEETNNEECYDANAQEFEIESKPDINDFTFTENFTAEETENMSLESTEQNVNDRTLPQPGSCPYCCYVEEKKKMSDMLRHLLVKHPCKPAYPCELCYRIYVKRNMYANHQKNCLPNLNP